MTILLAGHLFIPLALAGKQLFKPPLILISAIWLLPIAKGALIATQRANRMHGFAVPAPTQTPRPEFASIRLDKQGLMSRFRPPPRDQRPEEHTDG